MYREFITIISRRTALYSQAYHIYQPQAKAQFLIHTNQNAIFPLKQLT